MFKVAGNHGPFCLCGKCKKAMGFQPSAPRQRSSRQRPEAPYYEVGGGEPCEACNGTGECKRCNGTSWFTLRNGDSVRCRSCEVDRGKCKPCRGTGKNRPTRYRRDGN